MIDDIMQRAAIRAARHRHVENATRITPARAVNADTSHNGAHVAPAGETEMFRTDLTDYAVFASLVFALVGALVA